MIGSGSQYSVFWTDIFKVWWSMFTLLGKYRLEPKKYRPSAMGTGGGS